MTVNKSVTIITYISSKKEDIVENNDKYSFNVLPFYFEWNGKKGEINRIEIRNDRIRYDNDLMEKKGNVEKYREYAPNESQTDTWSSGQVSISFSEPVAKAEITGSTLVIDGSHWVDMWRGIYLDYFELKWIEEIKKGENKYLALGIKERKITTSGFSPTISYLEINFGNDNAKMAEYKANLQTGKKYYFNENNLENTKILTNKRLDINNSVNEIPKIRLFNEEGETITHPPIPNNNQPTSSIIKEKLLRNLDKISLDPIGYLADAELIKSNEVENNYKRGQNDPVWNTWNDKVHQVEIEGEKIDLTKLKWEDKLAVRKAIIADIKSNPRDWKIENSTIYEQPSQNISDSFKILKHKSGRRLWNVGIIHLNESWEKGKQDWAEIEALISNSTLPAQNQKIDWEDEIKKYFREHNIRSITLENDDLIIEYNDKSKKKVEVKNDDLQLQLIKQIVAEQKDHLLSFSKPQQNDNSQPKQNKNHQLAIGLAVGAGITILVGILIYFIRKIIKNNNNE